MKDELSYNERREWAKYLYLREDKSIPDVALEVNADEATVRHWVNTNAWEGMKTSLLTSKKNLLQQYYGQLQKMDGEIKTEQAPNPKAMDTYQKYINCIKGLEVELSIGEIIEPFELFVQWLNKKDNALSKKLTVYLDAFVKERLAA